jgi:hypothetical protein
LSEAIERFQQARAAIEADRPVDIDHTYAAILAAAEEGDPRAALLTAYANGVGYGCPIRLEAALEWLRIANERRAPGATVQVEMLTAGGDLAAWIAPRETRIVNEAPRIGMIDGFIDAQLCAWLIDRARPLQEASLVYDPKTGQPLQDDARTNSAGTFKLIDLDLPIILLRQRIANTIGAAVENFERTSVFRYQAGQAFADHADYISTAFSAEIRQRGQRPLTFVVYLNDAFGGGETRFLALDKKFRGGAGDALFWSNVDTPGAPDPLTQHAGDPPTSGEKWLLSQFIRDKAQMPG